MYKLKQHQKEGVKYLIEHHYALLADGMGLGKSLQAIEVVKRTKLRALIICPASLIYTWEKEIEKFSTLEKGKDFEIISYAKLSKCESLWAKSDIIICDEFHYVKNIEAKRTQHLFNLMDNKPPERFIGLTGTAIKNRVTEFYTLLYLLSLNPKGTSGINMRPLFPYQWYFNKHFCHHSQFKIGKRVINKFEGHKNIEELKRILKGKYLRRKASEVLDLPPIIRKDILLNNDEIDLELLNSLNNNAKAFATYKVNSGLVKVKPTSIYCTDLIEQGEGPLLIFSDNIIPCEEISKILSKKFKVRCITGQTPVIKREEAKELFQSGKLDALVCTIGSMSTGHTLTKARNLVFNDLSYVVGDIAQAEKRIHGIGQEHICVIHRMFWGKIDAHLAKMLDDKISTIKAVL